MQFNSKSMFTICDAPLNACWDTATARRHWTEQWRRESSDQAKRRLLGYQTEPILSIFVQKVQSLFLSKISTLRGFLGIEYYFSTF